MDNPEVSSQPAAPAEKSRKGQKRKQEKAQIEGRRVSANITLCNDGVYRWVYEFPMLKNPVILFTVIKILAYVALGIFALVALLAMVSGDFDFRDPLGIVSCDHTILAIMLGAFLGTVAVAYLSVAANYGLKYCVLFEMDEEGITHKMLPKQVEKAYVMGMITSAVGAAAGSFSTVFAGRMAKARTQISSYFPNVGKVRVLRRWDTIKLSETFAHNQVYVAPEDFDFVLDYIKARVPEKAAEKI